MKRALILIAVVLTMVGMTQTAVANPQLTAALGISPDNGYTLSSSMTIMKHFDGILETEALIGGWLDNRERLYQYDSSDPSSLDDNAGVSPSDGTPRVPTGSSVTQWSDLYGGLRMSVGNVNWLPSWIRVGAGLTYHYAWPIEGYEFSNGNGIGQARPLVFAQARSRAGDTELLVLELESMFRPNPGGDNLLDINNGSLKARDFRDAITMLKFGYRFDI
jgi:hypothetical protein